MIPETDFKLMVAKSLNTTILLALTAVAPGAAWYAMTLSPNDPTRVAAWIVAAAAFVAIFPTLYIGLRMREMRFLLDGTTWTCIAAALLLFAALGAGALTKDTAVINVASGDAMRLPNDLVMMFGAIAVVLAVFALAWNMWKGGPMFGLYLTCIQLTLGLALVAFIILLPGLRNPKDDHHYHDLDSA
jgi:hypothetical protein